jgi:protein CpxP
MSKHTKPIDIIDVTAFLAVSCEHLELDSACLYRAAHRVYAPPENQTSPQSEGQRKSMNHYRDIARNLLIAVGMGAFLAGPVLADPECPASGTSVTYHERHVKQMEQHHKQLHDALKLTAEQEPGWEKLTASERPAHGAPQTDWSKLTAPERAEKMLEFAQAHQERMSRHVAALKVFYETLSAEQQNIFENLHAGMREGMHGKPMHHLSSPDKPPAKS